MEQEYILETKDIFHEPLYYAGSCNVDNPARALSYSLDEAMNVARRLNNGNLHYKVVKKPCEKKERTHD